MRLKEISDLQIHQKILFPAVDAVAAVKEVDRANKMITILHTDNTITICPWSDLIVANVMIL